MPICVFTTDYITNIIYKHSGVNSRITARFSSPSTDCRGIDFSDTYLYSIDSDNNKIYQHSGYGSRILSSFAGPAYSMRSISVYDDIAYTVSSNTDKIYRHSGFSATIDESFSSPSTSPYGVFFDGTFLYSSDFSSKKIYKHSGFDSRILESFSSPHSSPLDISFDGTYLYSVDGGYNRIYMHSGFNSRVLDSFSSPAVNATGVAFSLYPVDGDHKIALSASESNQLEFTCDKYSEEDIDFDNYQRSSNYTLKHYVVGNKKKFNLYLKNISNADMTTLQTIYALKSELTFYYSNTSGNQTATVRWVSNFELLTPIRSSRQFLDTLYTGNIILEEV